MKTLKVYECRRYKQGDCEDFCGSLIIAAENEHSAISIFDKREDDYPEEMIEMEGVFATGEERVLYNDYLR